MHEQLKKSKAKTKSSRENTSVRKKCQLIADSQKGKNKGKSKGKSQFKKSKSKKKGESKPKDSLNSPMSQKKIVSTNSLAETLKQHPTSKSKSKKKKQSGCKPNSDVVNERSR